MAEVENLEIIIDVLDQYSDELLDLLVGLTTVEAVAESVENIRIDVDVHGERQLDTLLARLTAVGAAEGGVTAGALGRRGGGVRGGRIGVPDLPDFSDDLIRKLSRFGDGVTDATQSINEAAESSGLFDLRMSDMHNALAKLIPLIFVFIGALPALIGALVVLATAAVAAAAALAALTAFGALGFAAQIGGRENLMEGFSDILSELRRDFLDAFMPLAERLAPLFRDALDGLDTLFQNIANRGDALMELTDDARDFGGFLLDFIPQLLADMAAMADELGPVLAEIFSVFDFNVLRAMTAFMKDVADEFTLFLDLLIQFLPTIVEVSVGFLRVVNTIGVLLQALGALIGIIPISNELWGEFIAVALTAATVGLVLSRVWGVSAVSAIFAHIKSLGAMIATYLQYIPAVTAARAATIGFGLALGIATGGLTILLGGLTSLASGFLGLKSDVDSATDSLKEFDRISSRFGGDNPFGADSPTVRRGTVQPRGPFSSINVTIEGDADEEETRRQVHNALYRGERSRRSF